MGVIEFFQNNKPNTKFSEITSEYTLYESFEGLASRTIAIAIFPTYDAMRKS